MHRKSELNEKDCSKQLYSKKQEKQLILYALKCKFELVII